MAVSKPLGEVDRFGSRLDRRAVGKRPGLAAVGAGIIGPSAPSALFVGREQELDRLGRGLRDVGLATIVGLAGVGKSALAQRMAAAWRGPVTRHHARAGQSIAELLDDIRRSLADGESTPELRSDGERLSDAAARIDRSGALAIIEDGDRLGEPAHDLLAAMSAALRRGRVIVTGRTRFLANDGDRVDIVLDGLDQEAARDLWARLDDLHGARSGFDAAWQRARGNPFFLRRAHAGDAGGDDPIGATIAALDPDERRVALALALVGAPLARDLAARLHPRGHAVIGGLIARLVIEPTACGELVLHDLLGEGLLTEAGAAELAAAHRAIAGAVEGRLPFIAETRLRVRHLGAAGMTREARDLLMSRAAELVRRGAAGELLRGLDRVTGDDDAEARLARARVMARMLDLERAHEELVALGAERPDAGAELRASFAHLAMLTLRLDVAENVSRAGLLSPSVSPELRIRFATVYLLTSTYRGEGDAARAVIERAASALSTPVARGYAAFSRAFSLWLEERDDEAEQAMRAAWPLFCDAPAFRAGVLAPTFMVTVLARAGKVDDAAAALSGAEAALARFDDSLMRVSLRALRATVLESQGDFAAARDEATAAEHAFARAGHSLGALWARLLRARLTLYLGQVRDGRRLLEEVEREASAAGATLVVRLAARAGRANPWIAVSGAAPPPGSRPGERRRERVAAALRAVGAGQDQVARGYLAALEHAPLDPLERSLVAVAAWALDGAAHEARLCAACEDAARAGADPELLPAISAWLRDRTRSRPGPMRLIVVDRRSHTVRVDTLVVELARRPALRRLLYAMLDAPGRAHDKPALARAIWGVDYRPAHDGALWVNVKRLRALLAPAGLRVTWDDDGVRLSLESDCELQLI